MRRVQVFVPEDLERHRGNWEGDVNWAEMRVTVRLRDGRELDHGRSHARGWPEDVPVTLDDVAGKFRECADGVLANAQSDEAIAMVRELQRLDDVGELMAALRAG